jgi:hypothetical protein
MLGNLHLFLAVDQLTPLLAEFSAWPLSRHHPTIRTMRLAD